jgi:ketosteroid isomerase-like protein
VTATPDHPTSRHPSQPRDTIGVGGARTPEELETLLEDAFVTRDRTTLATLFEAEAVLVPGDGAPARGEAAIARWSAAMWAGGRTHVADPWQVAQARDLALVVAVRGISVMRRGSDGSWRYVISLLSLDDTTR